MNRKYNYPIRRVFILDELAIAIALFIALVIRYSDKIVSLNQSLDGLYTELGVTICLSQVIVFIMYDNRRKPIFEKDPLENLMAVVKSRSILLAMALLYLFAVHQNILSCSGSIFCSSAALDWISGHAMTRELYA